MSSSGPDYKKLYIQQDKVLSLLVPYLRGYYLTGGTALGRFYLGHRYSDDLDFFLNQNSEFKKKTQELFTLLKSNYSIDETVTFQSTDFIRIMILDEVPLKIEFVNDIAYHWGKTLTAANNVPVDNVANILANKLTALLGRDEPKDVFDIISIAGSFSFNWKEIYKHAFEKQIMNEADVVMRLQTFPAELLATQPWLMHPVNIDSMKEKLEIISDDFLFAGDNSLGSGKVPIMEAVPSVNSKL
jgi:predicted nucleotidyltransferase component of viral defense system